MPIDNPRYDVAISFLSKDEAIAEAIYRRLSEGLKVFFFPRNQEVLAGTDGLESMRMPFFDDSRVMVVLYREPWGKTPWTRVEETAIKEGCLEHGWKRLFFIVLDRESAIPLWLPQNHVRFNYSDFGLEQAAGAIKARVQENGGQPLPLTPMKRAELFQAEEQFRLDKSRMSSPDGMKEVRNSVAELFREIRKHCADINAKGFLQIECEAELIERGVYQTCVMRGDEVSMSVIWTQPYSNTADKSCLRVREYNGRLILPSEMASRIYVTGPPLKSSEIEYAPDLSLAREFGWKIVNTTEFVSCSALAEQCVIRFMDLASRRRAQLEKHTD